MSGNFWLSLTGVFFILLSVNPGHALLRLQVKQVGSAVVITGSGSANTSGLNLVETNNDWTNVLVNNQIYAGPDAFSDGTGAGTGADVSLWSSITGPAVFGTDPSVFINPDSGSGDLFGIVSDGTPGAPLLVLPQSYTSGAALNGSSTFFNQSFSSLGFTPGSSFTWNWGSGSSTDSLVLEVQDASTDAVPGPLPIAGAALALAQSRRLRRRAEAGRG